MFNTQLKFSKNFTNVFINCVPTLSYCHYGFSNRWMPSILCAFHNHNINRNKINNLQVLSFNKKDGSKWKPWHQEIMCIQNEADLELKMCIRYLPKIKCWWLSSDIQNFVVVCNMRYILLNIVQNLHFSLALNKHERTPKTTVNNTNKYCPFPLMLM